MPTGTVQVHKGASHQNLEGADPVERWAFTCKNHADLCAQMSLREPQHVFLLWQQAVTAIDDARTLRNQIHDTIIQVSASAVVKETRMAPTEVPAEPFPLPLTEATIAPLEVGRRCMAHHFRMVTKLD